jgi:hypothetical protein
VLVESSTGSIALLPYRYPPQLQRHQRYGTYRPSWITFLDDRVGREALAWWRNRCIEWCHDRMEMGRFGSQKYLDDWPERFQDVHVLRHEGAGVAPWNVAAHPISRGPDGLHAGGAPLVFYDFRGFKRIASWLFDPNVARYRAELTPALRDEVYRPYVGELRVIERQVRRGVGGVPPGWGRAKGPGLGGLMVRSLRGQLLTIS